MLLKSLADVDVSGQTILYRVAYDVPLEEVEGKLAVADDFRIRATLPTIKYLLTQNCRLLILSWLGRPGGEVVESLRMDPVAERLESLLGESVTKLDDCVGESVALALSDPAARIILFENVRFHPEENANDSQFAQALVEPVELIVQDAFAQLHRDVASISGIVRYRPVVAGYLVEKEVKVLSRIRDHPQLPLVVIVGGAKLETKEPAIRGFIDRAETILLGGKVPLDPQAEEYRGNPKVIFPEDYLDDKDIGPKTIAGYQEVIARAQTIIWNGPLGIFEEKRYANGTRAIAQAVAASGAESIAGGSDTIAAINEFGLADQFTHLSTGGGALLEFLTGKDLPGLKALLKMGPADE